ncbi:hypothetical protein M3Y97_00263300 [Aphelenchoides bicaudatus]|nr:hypothetical protein M3Y97_00263300 [Aphelenchoides bicaudatus]
MFFYLNYIQTLAEEDGKRLIGWTASTAQIAGSLIHAIIYSIGINDFYLLASLLKAFTVVHVQVSAIQLNFL